MVDGNFEKNQAKIIEIPLCDNLILDFSEGKYTLKAGKDTLPLPFEFGKIMILAIKHSKKLIKVFIENQITCEEDVKKIEDRFILQCIEIQKMFDCYGLVLKCLGSDMPWGDIPLNKIINEEKICWSLMCLAPRKRINTCSNMTELESLIHDANDQSKESDIFVVRIFKSDGKKKIDLKHALFVFKIEDKLFFFEKAGIGGFTRCLPQKYFEEQFLQDEINNYGKYFDVLQYDNFKEESIKKWEELKNSRKQHGN